MRGAVASRLPVLVFAAIVVTRVPLLVWQGVGFAPDSASYAAWAEALIAARFDYPAFLAQVQTPYPAVLYSAWVTVVALCKLAFGGAWAHAVVTLNVLGEATAAALAARLAMAAAGGPMAGFVAGAFAVGAADLAMWDHLVLSDPTFVALAFAAFAVPAQALATGRDRGVAAAAAAVLAVVAAFYRPTAMALLPSLALVLVLLAVSRPVTSHVSAAWLRAALGGVAALIGLGLAVFAAFMRSPGAWPIAAGRRLIEFTAGRYAMGEVVWDRPNTFHAVPGSYADYLWLAVDRFLHFFYVVNASFSAAHNLLAVVFYLPLYGLALTGLWAALAPRPRLADGGRLVVALAAIVVLTTAAFHGMVQVDYDWRYRVTILPHLLVMAAVGAAVLAGREGRPDAAAPQTARS